MDFSKLNSTEKMAVYGAVAAVLGGVVGGISGILWLAVLAALGVLAVLFVPMFSPTMTMPGSKGSLLVALGGVAAVSALLGLLIVLPDIGFWFEFQAVRMIFFLIGVAGSLLMFWAGWQAFQAEGGKFNVGMSSSSSTSAAAPPPAPMSAPPPAPMSSPPPMTPPASPPPAAPAPSDDENRQP